ncbi:pyruvate decarboxylase, partial [Aureobasidium melanogenum]
MVRCFSPFSSSSSLAANAAPWAEPGSEFPRYQSWRPEVLLCNDLCVFLAADAVGGLGTSLDVQLAHLLDDLAEDAVHADTRVFVEIGLDCADAENKIGALNTVANTLVRTITSVHTTVVGESLVDTSLTKRSNECGQARLDDQIVLQDNIDDVIFLLFGVGRVCQVDGLIESLALNLVLNNVASCGSVGILEVGDSAGNRAEHVDEDIVVAVTESVAPAMALMAESSPTPKVLPTHFRPAFSRADATLLQTSKDVLGNGDGLLERACANVLRSHGGVGSFRWFIFQMLEHKKLQRWTAPWNTLGASSFPTVNRTSPFSLRPYSRVRPTPYKSLSFHFSCNLIVLRKLMIFHMLHSQTFCGRRSTTKSQALASAAPEPANDSFLWPSHECLFASLLRSLPSVGCLLFASDKNHRIAADIT